jgi:hypothetical protein
MVYSLTVGEKSTPEKPLPTNLHGYIALLVQQCLFMLSRQGDPVEAFQEQDPFVYQKIHYLLDAMQIKVDTFELNDEYLGNAFQQLDHIISETSQSMISRPQNAYPNAIYMPIKTWMISRKTIGLLYWQLGVGHLAHQAALAAADGGNGESSNGDESGATVPNSLGSNHHQLPNEFRKVWCDEAQLWLVKALALISAKDVKSDNRSQSTNGFPHQGSQEAEAAKSFTSALYTLMNIEKPRMVRNARGILSNTSIACMFALALDMMSFANHKERHSKPNTSEESTFTLHDMLNLPEGPSMEFLKRQFAAMGKLVIQSLMSRCSACMDLTICKAKELSTAQRNDTDTDTEWMDVLSIACPHVNGPASTAASPAS